MTKPVKYTIFFATLATTLAIVWHYVVTQVNLIKNNTTFKIVGGSIGTLSVENTVINLDIEVTNNSDISFTLAGAANLDALVSFDGGLTQTKVANISNVSKQVVPAKGKFVLPNVEIAFSPNGLSGVALSGILNWISRKETIVYIRGTVDGLVQIGPRILQFSKYVRFPVEQQYIL